MQMLLHLGNQRGAITRRAARSRRAPKVNRETFSRRVSREGLHLLPRVCNYFVGTAEYSARERLCFPGDGKNFIAFPSLDCNCRITIE